MKKKLRSIFMFCALISISPIINAQTYCSPDFAFGCSNWRNVNISLGTLNWSLGADDCLISDYTNLSTSLNAGTAYPMSVECGVWSGCAVYVDYNDDGTFDSSENLYYSYQGADPTFTYIFNITIPTTVASGPHRMRVVAGWGSDCFTPGGSNGYGACGSYQYGNFDDFTVNVANTLGINENAASIANATVSPNPVMDKTILHFNSTLQTKKTIKLSDVSGKLMHSFVSNQATETIDFSGFDCGVYFIAIVADNEQRVLKVVK
jgi:hypothetical protein